MLGTEHGFRLQQGPELATSQPLNPDTTLAERINQLSSGGAQETKPCTQTCRAWQPRAILKCAQGHGSLGLLTRQVASVGLSSEAFEPTTFRLNTFDKLKSFWTLAEKKRQGGGVPAGNIPSQEDGAAVGGAPRSTAGQPPNVSVNGDSIYARR